MNILAQVTDTALESTQGRSDSVYIIAIILFILGGLSTLIIWQVLVPYVKMMHAEHVANAESEREVRILHAQTLAAMGITVGEISDRVIQVHDTTNNIFSKVRTLLLLKESELKMFEKIEEQVPTVDLQSEIAEARGKILAHKETSSGD